MGSYSSWEDCITKNQDKDNPEAYCGMIKAEIEGEQQKLNSRVLSNFFEYDEEADCNWITTSTGAKVCIGGDGTIKKGPEGTVGKNVKDIGKDSVGKTSEKDSIQQKVDNIKNKVDTNVSISKVKVGMAKDLQESKTLIQKYSSYEEAPEVSEFEDDLKNYSEGKDVKNKDRLESVLVNKEINKQYLSKIADKDGTITLYRGYKTSESRLPTDQLVSFTSDDDIAYNFMGTGTIRAKVPIDNIYFSHITDKTLDEFGEKEFTVFIPKKDLRNVFNEDL